MGRVSAFLDVLRKDFGVDKNTWIRVRLEESINVNVYFCSLTVRFNEPIKSAGGSQ